MNIDHIHFTENPAPVVEFLVFFIDYSRQLIFFIYNFAIISRGSNAEAFYKKAVLKNFAKSTGKHLCQSSIFNKIAGPQLQEK